jgi:hypothetical protein
VKAGKICAPAFAACIGDVAKDAAEGVQGMPAARERLGCGVELAHGQVV